MKAWSKNKKVNIRNPNSTRPWQHVLEALHGYLILAKKLKKNSKLNGEPFNFGPRLSQNKSVKSLLEEMKINWHNVKWKVIKNKKNVYESKLLKLNSLKAEKKIKWRPVLNFKQTTKMITDWYQEYFDNKSKVFDISKKQINIYSNQILKFKVSKV